MGVISFMQSSLQKDFDVTTELVDHVKHLDSISLAFYRCFAKRNVFLDFKTEFQC